MFCFRIDENPLIAYLADSVIIINIGHAVLKRAQHTALDVYDPRVISRARAHFRNGTILETEIVSFKWWFWATWDFLRAHLCIVACRAEEA